MACPMSHIALRHLPALSSYLAPCRGRWCEKSGLVPLETGEALDVYRLAVEGQGPACIIGIELDRHRTRRDTAGRAASLSIGDAAMIFAERTAIAGGRGHRIKRDQPACRAIGAIDESAEKQHVILDLDHI